MKFRVTQIQFLNRTKEYGLGAVSQVRDIIDQEVPADTDLVCLPEMFCCPYSNNAFPVFAEEEGGPVFTALSKLAAGRRVWLSAGSVPEKGEGGRIYNTAYVFAPDGTKIAKHRKMHLFDIDVEGGVHFHESDTLTPGDEITVFDTDFGRMGLSICYDVRFPELWRLMALKGARVILNPGSFNQSTGPLHWELSYRAQAMFNQVWAIGTAPALDERSSYRSWAHSIIADPWGRTVSQLDFAPAVHTEEIDLDQAEEVRQQIPLLRHRRTDIYSLEEIPRVDEENAGKRTETRGRL